VRDVSGDRVVVVHAQHLDRSRHGTRKGVVGTPDPERESNTLVAVELRVVYRPERNNLGSFPVVRSEGQARRCGDQLCRIARHDIDGDGSAGTEARIACPRALNGADGGELARRRRDRGRRRFRPCRRSRPFGKRTHRSQGRRRRSRSCPRWVASCFPRDHRLRRCHHCLRHQRRRRCRRCSRRR
jgi:hypothetical protein